MTPPTSPSSSMIMAKMKSENAWLEEVTLYGVARSLADDIAGGDGDTCVGYLGVFVYIEFCGRHYLVTRKLLDTGTPRVEPVQERYVAVLCHQQESYGNNAYRCQAAGQHQQSFCRDTPYEHHQKDYPEQQCRRG